MTARMSPRRRPGGVLRVVGAADPARRAPRAGGAGPIRPRRGRVGPPRRHDDRRWETDVRGWTDG
ncbi:hypothetical protein C1I93_27160 [Micromonospora endophytica]|uniref:Uncharacterized protein n=1 Tax=Micromonospora endophytica TaxID=515350 RepID=A0A2W2BIH0_9ACTN|nr:hypothetical protein C1I93_27160 [Micromonospora endophytica]RIW41748.1 hypothetical protein D3H59_24890 [Micromonospora endophytica]